MAIGVIIAIVIVIVLLAAVAGAVLLRRRALRHRFGPEYDRLAQEVGERRAVAELSERQRRIEQLDIRPLSAERRAGYDTRWTMLQEQFVDGPADTTEEAAALVIAVAADRGYQVVDEDQLLEDLSVYHADRIDGYRRARQTTKQPGTAGTEELRQAMLAYRGLLHELLDLPESAGGRATEAPASTPASVADDTDDTDGTEVTAGTGAAARSAAEQARED